MKIDLPQFVGSEAEALERLWKNFAGSRARLRLGCCVPSRLEEKALGQAFVAGIRAEMNRSELALEQIRTSVTHSRGLVLAVGAWGMSGVGVDLERADRALSSKAFERIVSPSEREWGLRPIEFWAIKEAAYKASPGSLGTVLPQYRVRAAVKGEGGGWEGQVVGPQGNSHFRARAFSEWFICFALGQ